ncbi:MAG: hypothetical protein IPP49_15430 [Saprospiraceae bacterium]|nr:hypothetical protein [Saprospiraceae bacterium]
MMSPSNGSKFDNKNKTIFGKPGNWAHDVINLIFTERQNQVAYYIQW